MERDSDGIEVDALDSGGVDGEDEWPAEYAFTVSHWPAHMLAFVVGAVFAFFTVLGVLIQSPLVIALFLVAFLGAVWLLLAFGETKLTERSVTHSALLGRFAIGWDEITEVVVDSGGNTVVLRGGGKQLVLPGFSFWAGREKRDARDIFEDELEWRSIPLKSAFAAFAVSRNTRVR
jgi:drug/metabolite transporter (DMT)-like permease